MLSNESNSSVATLVLHHSTHGLSMCPELVSPKDAVALQHATRLMSDLLAGPQTGSAESRLTERAGSRAMPASAASLRGTFAHFLGLATSGLGCKPPGAFYTCISFY